MPVPSPDTTKPERPPIQFLSWWIVAIALICGILIGQSISSEPGARAADPDKDATATRTAELDELHAMQTQVAQPVVCTPAPSPTATATPTPEPTATLVPATVSGQAMAYGSDWVITVSSIAPAPVPEGFVPRGQLMRVNLTIENLTGKPLTPPFDELRLVDAAGNVYSIDKDATAEISGEGWGLKVRKNSTDERGLVFDVAADAGDQFLLESETEPAFRITLTVESRG